MKAGRTTPPAGWSAAREVEPYRKANPTPKPSKRVPQGAKKTKGK